MTENIKISTNQSWSAYEAKTSIPDFFKMNV
jgi:hypothetical protein